MYLPTTSPAHPSSPTSCPARPPELLEFFAGSGLVSYALRGLFKSVWANDICPKKARVYTANHGAAGFHLGPIQKVRGAELPAAALSWASFPCQDLSLAGSTAGIHAKRSGLVWEWLRVIDEMPRRPPLLVAENVVGLLCSRGGSQYALLHAALTQRGYRAGAVVLDAARFVPQSRPRVFVIAVAASLPLPPEVTTSRPGWLQPGAVVRAASELPDFVHWQAPEPPPCALTLAELVDRAAPCDPPARQQRNLAMLVPRHRERLLRSGELDVVPGYRRTRRGKVVLELRFDGRAGCLRTPGGGSSRQLLVLKGNEEPGAAAPLRTRLLTVKEAAALMGAPPEYQVPGSYNDGYKALGDAVAVPVARFLGERLLLPLWQHLTGAAPAAEPLPAS
ncbi:MAG TPA: DNA cytosine methyltransferase [Pseudomonadota bacterium]|nr:DNA cytosine methyltransferase [Pseudomonadota bacterium]